MKNLKFQELSISDANVLSRQQMKKITGGFIPPSPCVSDGLECYSVGSTVYTCFTEWEGDEVKSCCCGHDAGNDECYAT